MRSAGILVSITAVNDISCRISIFNLARQARAKCGVGTVKPES